MTGGAPADSVRVTVTSGSRRVDLVLPGAVPIAELVPELVCLAGAPTPPVSYRLTSLTGVELTPEAGLAAQGVPDGSILLLTAAASVPPQVYDDAAEAMAQTVDRATPADHPSHRGRLVAFTAPVLLAGAAVLPGDAAPLPAQAPRGVVAAAAGCLLLAVVAGYLLPRLALAATGLLADPAGFAARTDADRAAVVGSAHDLLLAGSSVSAVLLVLAAPAVAWSGPSGVLAALLGGGVVLLRARRPRSVVVARVDRLSGAGALLTAAAAVLVTAPEWRPAVAVALLGGVAAAARLPWTWARSLRWCRIADLAETLALVALPAVLVLATGVGTG
jgi:hypothetical protein